MPTSLELVEPTVVELAELGREALRIPVRLAEPFEANAVPARSIVTGPTGVESCVIPWREDGRHGKTQRVEIIAEEPGLVFVAERLEIRIVADPSMLADPPT